jgi:hypothetical protein
MAVFFFRDQTRFLDFLITGFEGYHYSRNDAFGSPKFIIEPVIKIAEKRNENGSTVADFLQKSIESYSF